MKTKYKILECNWFVNHRIKKVLFNLSRARYKIFDIKRNIVPKREYRIRTLELMWPWSVNGAKPTKRHQTLCWSIIGPKLLVGIFTDQQYCTYNVQYHRCLYLPTNNIAPSTCKHFARWRCKMFAQWRCKMLLILGGAVGSLTVGSWQLAVGCWQLAVV